MRRQHRGTITDGNHRVGTRLGTGPRHRRNRLRFVMETNRDRLIEPGIVQLIAAIAREQETHSERLGGLAERADLISRRGGDEQDPLHR